MVVNRILRGKGAFGFNAQTEVYEDLEKAGVIDPTKVSRTALQNAASVASLLLTTEAMVADKPKKKAARAAGPAAGMRRRHGRHGLLSPEDPAHWPDFRPCAGRGELGGAASRH